MHSEHLTPNTEALGPPPRSVRKLLFAIAEIADLNEGQVVIHLTLEEMNLICDYLSKPGQGD